MEKKSFKKYFTQSNTLLWVSIGILGGAALLWLATNYLFFSWELYQASYVIATIGAICLITHFTIRIKDSAVDEYIQTLNKAMESQLDAFVNETEKHKIIKKVYSFTSNSYNLSSEAVQFLKFGSDSTPRCELCQGVALTHTPQTLYVVVGNLNLLTGDTTYTKFSAPVNEIKTVQTVDKSFTKEYKKNNKYVETHIMEISAEQANISFTVHADAMTDEAVQRLNRLAENEKG